MNIDDFRSPHLTKGQVGYKMETDLMNTLQQLSRYHGYGRVAQVAQQMVKVAEAETRNGIKEKK